MEKNKNRIGSEPSKEVFGNTPEHPDNVKPCDKTNSDDPIIKGAQQDNLKPKPPGAGTNGSSPEQQGDH